METNTYAYTFIASRVGEVFTAQISAMDISEACLSWGKQFMATFHHDDFDSADFWEDLSFKVEEMPPVLVENAVNFWCFSFVVLGSVMWVHIVKTAALDDN